MSGSRRGRTASILVSIEPAIYVLLRDYVDKRGVSASSYARELIVNDLRAKGLLPDAVIAELFSGAA